MPGSPSRSLGRSHPDIWSPHGFNKSWAWVCWRRSMARSCGGQSPCRGRKQCCWLYLQTSSGPQRILSSPQGLIFHSVWHQSHSKSYRHLWLCISTRPKDYVQTHPRCLFLEGRQSACQLSLGRGLFAKNDGWWDFRISIWFSFLNLNTHQKFSDYGEVIWMYTLCTLILLFYFFLCKS